MLYILIYNTESVSHDITSEATSYGTIQDHFQFLLNLMLQNKNYYTSDAFSLQIILNLFTSQSITNSDDENEGNG